MIKIKGKNILAIVLFFSATLCVQNVFSQDGKQIYRLIVSFGSICCGTNKEAEKEIIQTISLYEKEKGVKLHRKKVYWGKEGEFDYCFKLSEISKTEQKKLIAKIKSIAERTKQVEVRENVANPNER